MSTGQLSKLEKMYASLNTCHLHLLEYTRSHQERCPWFLFLTSDDVLRFICQSSSNSTFLSSSVYKIVPTIHSLGLGWSNNGEEISEIIGCNGDVLTLDNVRMLVYTVPSYESLYCQLCYCMYMHIHVFLCTVYRLFHLMPPLKTCWSHCSGK